MRQVSRKFFRKILRQEKRSDSGLGSVDMLEGTLKMYLGFAL